MSKAKEEYYKIKSCLYDDSINTVFDYITELEQQNKEMLDMIKLIPCTCDNIYKKRNLCAPDCPRCNYINEEVLKDE